METTVVEKKVKKPSKEAYKPIGFEEQWPETHEEQFFNGRNYQEQLDRIRQEQFRLEDIYKRDPELYEWWTREKK